MEGTATEASNHSPYMRSATLSCRRGKRPDERGSGPGCRSGTVSPAGWPGHRYGVAYEDEDDTDTGEYAGLITQAMT